MNCYDLFHFGIEDPAIANVRDEMSVFQVQAQVHLSKSEWTSYVYILGCHLHYQTYISTSYAGWVCVYNVRKMR